MSDGLTDKEREFVEFILVSVRMFGGCAVTALRVAALCIEGVRQGKSC